MKRAVLQAPESELAEWLIARGEKAFRARQVRQWIVERRAAAFASMTDLPKGLRCQLGEDWQVFGSVVRRTQGDCDSTRKLLLQLADGQTVECVLLFQEQRRTVCLSTQVGCGMGCVFCASGLAGVERNLTTGEMVEELLLARNLLQPEERLTHVVVMGMGEPLANLDNLLPALDFATNPKGLGLSARHVTISTVGLPGKIVRLAREKKAYHLAVSLHAPNDELRRRIVRSAERVSLVEILEAADEFRAVTGRQVTFEYVLLGDLNDAADDAAELAALLRGRDSMINLIPYNPVAGLPYRTPTTERTGRFAATLRHAGFTVKTRKRKGAGIDAACGQLRRAHLPTAETTLPVIAFEGS